MDDYDLPQDIEEELLELLTLELLEHNDRLIKKLREKGMNIKAICSDSKVAS